MKAEPSKEELLKAARDLAQIDVRPKDGWICIQGEWVYVGRPSIKWPHQTQ